MPKPLPPPRKRVELFPPGATEPAASIFVTVHEADGKEVLRPEHDYPDFAPAVGWTAVRRDWVREIVSVDDNGWTVEGAV